MELSFFVFVDEVGVFFGFFGFFLVKIVFSNLWILFVVDLWWVSILVFSVNFVVGWLVGIDEMRLCLVVECWWILFEIDEGFSFKFE